MNTKEYKWASKWAENLIKDENINRKDIPKIDSNYIFAQLIDQNAIKKPDLIETAIQKVLPSIGTIWIKTPKEKWNGSGFLIGNQRFITAAHVLQDMPEDSEILVSFNNEDFINARVLSSNDDVDAAVVLLENMPEEIEPLVFTAPENIKVGEQVAVIGAPSGWHDIVTVGRISAIHQNLPSAKSEAFQDMILIDADIEPGSSGSAVVDTNGNVIGIVMALIGQNANLGLGQRAVSPSYKLVDALVAALQKRD